MIVHKYPKHQGHFVRKNKPKRKNIRILWKGCDSFGRIFNGEKFFSEHGLKDLLEDNSKYGFSYPRSVFRFFNIFF